MKKSYLAAIAIAAIAVISLLCIGISGILPNNQGGSDRTGAAETRLLIGEGVEKVEVLHFHGTHQCDSCIKVGQYAEDTVNAYFLNETASGILVFAHVNGDLPENIELASKYGATGSSLWIGVYDSSGFHAEQNTNVWYKINDRQGYMSYLKDIITEKLSGVS
ncbi:MAG: nitrophenyl compound nitroreductase subunit ArsF family protein [Candidatus Aenigmarchaeota archaeon]|nr:nitrophenyl compound nitroreductase subunit ArsF family protein [Candidatus Aenigmarchaeota archaeon]